MEIFITLLFKIKLAMFHTGRKLYSFFNFPSLEIYGDLLIIVTDLIGVGNFAQ